MAETYESGTRTGRAWQRIFLIGLALWIATVVVTFLTGNPNLIPTMVLTGSFLVPVTFVAWAFERRNTGEVTATLVFNTFLTGGVLGVLGASVLETYLLHPSALLFLGVGLIEEGVKLVALALLTRHLVVKSVRDPRRLRGIRVRGIRVGWLRVHRAVHGRGAVADAGGRDRDPAWPDRPVRARIVDGDPRRRAFLR